MGITIRIIGKVLTEGTPPPEFPPMVNIKRCSGTASILINSGADILLISRRLDFIAACRTGPPHDYDAAEGPMADDAVFNYVQSFLDSEISRAAFWEPVKFKRPTHQISFHTEKPCNT